jgi:hypothetical protein
LKVIKNIGRKPKSEFSIYQKKEKKRDCTYVMVSNVMGVSLRCARSFKERVHSFDILHHLVLGWKGKSIRQNTSYPLALKFKYEERRDLVA